MSRHDPRVSLLQMQDYARRALAVARSRTVEDLTSDDVFRLAIERALEVIGEAAKPFTGGIASEISRCRMAEDHRNAHCSNPWLRHCSP